MFLQFAIIVADRQTDINMKYTTDWKKFSRNGEDFKIRATIRLDDECKNGHEDFAITGEVVDRHRRPYEHAGDGWYHYMGGMCHDEIMEHFPEFEPFIKLHLSDFTGGPMYAEGNAHHYLRQGNLDYLQSHLRLLDEELDFFKENIPHDPAEGKELLWYYLIEMGIVRRWKREADAAIKQLEKLVSDKLGIPHTFTAKGKPRFKLDPERFAKVAKKIESGYYSKEQIQARADAILEKERIEAKAEAIEKRDKSIVKAEREYEFKKWIIDSPFFRSKNWIFYDHSMELAINWKSFEPQIDRQEFLHYWLDKGVKKFPFINEIRDNMGKVSGSGEPIWQKAK